LAPHCGANYLIIIIDLAGCFDRVIRIDLVELPHTLEVPQAEAATESSGQAVRKLSQNLLSVSRALFSRLLHLDDLSSDLPVGMDHGRVHDPGRGGVAN
jgi:hypothetical protein